MPLFSYSLLLSDGDTMSDAASVDDQAISEGTRRGDSSARVVYVGEGNSDSVVVLVEFVEEASLGELLLDGTIDVDSDTDNSSCDDSKQKLK